MLKIINTKKLTGVTISGSHDDLYEVYEAIERVLGPEHFEDMTALRILGVCYDLRHCFMGDRDIETVENGFHEHLQKYHGFIHPSSNVHFKVNILWIETIFAVLALDDYVKRYKDDKLFIKMINDNELAEEQKNYYEETRIEDLALVNLFQKKVWRAFSQVCGMTAYKKLYKKANTNNDYSQYTNYCTHYLDSLEMKYIYSKPDKREKLLATLVRKIIVKGDDYYQLSNDISTYASSNNIPKEDIRLAEVEYPESIDW